MKLILRTIVYILLYIPNILTLKQLKNIQCPQNCNGCVDDKTCYSCEPNYSLSKENVCENCLIIKTVLCTPEYKFDICQDKSLYIFQTQVNCLCPKRFFQVEPGSCLECPANCLSCTQNQCEIYEEEKQRLLQIASCQESFYQNIDGSCLECSASCQLCNNNTECTECFPNYQLLQKNCKCLQGMYVKKIEKNSLICEGLKIKQLYSDCSTISGEIFFRELNVVQINFIATDSIRLINETLDQCSELFQEQTVQLLGKNPFCILLNNQFLITLGDQSTILIGDSLELNPGILLHPECSILITNYNIGQVQNTTNQYVPSVDFNDNQKIKKFSSNETIKGSLIVGVCSDVTFSISDILNDGGKQLIFKGWEIKQIDPPIENQLSESLIIQLNEGLGGKFFTISSLHLQASTTYCLTLSYQNFLGFNGVTEMQFLTEDSQIQLLLKLLENNSQFHVYDYIQLGALIQIIDCTTEYNILQLPVNYLITIEDSNLNSLSIVQTGALEATNAQRYLTTEFQPYQLSPENSYSINYDVNITVEGIFMSQQKTLILEIVRSELVAQLKGGSRQVGYQDPLILEVDAIDQDYQNNIFIFQWACLNLNQNDTCKDVFNNVLEFNYDYITTIPAKNLEPYNSYLFIIQVKNQHGKFAKTQGTIVVIEQSLPSLNISIPTEIRSQEINLNTWIRLDFVYNTTDPDALYYAGALIYNFDVVATLQFSYIEFRFKMWNHFSNFKETMGNEIVLRASIYNPRYLMPAQTTIKLKVNYPPRNCSIKISPLTGIEFDTQFTISVENCYDIGQQSTQFSYEFWLYQNAKSKLEDDVQAKARKRGQFKLDDNIVAKQNIHPYFLGYSNSEKLIIMTTVSDSQGGIWNFSIPVTIQQQKNLSIEKLNQTLQSLKTNLQKQIIQVILLSSRMSIELDQYGQLTDFKLQLVNMCYDFYQNDISIQIIDQIYNSISGLISQNEVKDKLLRLDNMDNLIQQINSFIDFQNNLSLTIQTQALNNSNNALNNKDLDIIENSMQRHGEFIKALNAKCKQFLDDQTKNISDGVHINTPIFNQIAASYNQINNLEKRISESLLNNALPNLGAKVIQTENQTISSQLATKKSINDALGGAMDSKKAQDMSTLTNEEAKIDNQTDLAQTSDPNNTTNISILIVFIILGIPIYSLLTTNSKNNPYRVSQQFPYPNQDYPRFESKILVDVPDTSSSCLKAQAIPNKKFFYNLEAFSKKSGKFGTLMSSCLPKKQTIDVLSTLKYAFNVENAQENMTCVSQASNQSWGITTCISVVNPIKKSVECECDTISPVSIINDTLGLFKDSNLTIFSMSTIYKMNQYAWYQSPVIYILVFKTAIFLILIQWAHRKDHEDQSKQHELKSNEKVAKIVEEHEKKHQEIIKKHKLELVRQQPLRDKESSEPSQPKDNILEFESLSFDNIEKAEVPNYNQHNEVLESQHHQQFKKLKYIFNRIPENKKSQNIEPPCSNKLDLPLDSNQNQIQILIVQQVEQEQKQGEVQREGQEEVQKEGQGSGQKQVQEQGPIQRQEQGPVQGQGQGQGGSKEIYLLMPPKSPEEQQEQHQSQQKQEQQEQQIQQQVNEEEKENLVEQVQTKKNEPMNLVDFSVRGYLLFLSVKKQNIYLLQTAHEFFGIFENYIPQEPRTFRFTLHYIGIIYTLAMTMYFGVDLTIVRIVILSIIQVIGFKIIGLIMKYSFASPKKYCNAIGSIFGIMFSAFCIFVILAMIATAQNAEQTNIMAIMYLIVYMADHYVYQVFELLLLYKTHEVLSARFTSADNLLKVVIMKLMNKNVKGFFN